MLRHLNDELRQQQPSVQLLQVVRIKGKGFGVLAGRDISAGERLLEESPLMRAAPTHGDEPVLQNVERAALSLTAADQANLFSLHQHTGRFGEEKTLEGVWMTNALPLDHGFSGIFLQAARFNHDCCPSAYACWNGQLEKETVHAIADIKRGSEITISYFREGTRLERQEHLQSAFGFECLCAMCGLTGAALEKSDVRQERIRELDEVILAASQAHRPKKEVLALVEERIHLLGEEGFAPSRAKRTMVDAIQVCQAHGDVKGASEWARKARKLVLISGGADSPELALHDEVIQTARGRSSGQAVGSQLADGLAKAGM